MSSKIELLPNKIISEINCHPIFKAIHVSKKIIIFISERPALEICQTFEWQLISLIRLGVT